MEINAETTLKEILEYAATQKVTDLHLSAGMPATVRADEGLINITSQVITQEQMIKFISEYLPQERFNEFQIKRELDYSFGIPGLCRYRANLYYNQGQIACAIRSLPGEPPTFDQIGFPRDVAERLLSKPSGLILVTGPTGSGKTTTLAAMIDHINTNEPYHIITIEDPIEVSFKSKKSIVHQREVGTDTLSFAQGLKYALRQDPDVILIGEMRDLETISIALTVAETGHLVFATLHTPDCVQAINRIIDVFPAHQQQQVRTQLSFVLQGVICQQLMPKVGGGLVMAPEILITNPAVRALIRDSKIHQIYSSIEMGQKEGMRTLNYSLVQLVRAGKITREIAQSRTSDIVEFERIFQQAK